MALGAAPDSRLPDAPATARDLVSIEVRNLSKSFDIPSEDTDTLKERFVHPLRRNRPRRLDALDDVSFDIGRGEFFGICGANASGKSTLLKILAGIYRADSGRVRIAGRVAPIIELGVGFHPELAARDNTIVNAVMLGLSPQEAADRADEVIAFAELGDFRGLKLKNYSTGMRVRLAFAIVAHSEADVMLLDEVLAVGDARFRKRSRAEMARLSRDEGRTMVFVTHQLPALKSMCDRAMLLHEGRLEAIGDPEEVTRRYEDVRRRSTGLQTSWSGGGEASGQFAPVIDGQSSEGKDGR